MRRNLLIIMLILGLIVQFAYGTKLAEIKVVDKDYLMLRFVDGVVNFVDDGQGEGAYSAKHLEANANAQYFGARLDATIAADPATWIIKSSDDSNYGNTGVAPTAVYRKSRVNGMDIDKWGSNDWIFNYTKEHFMYLELPTPMNENSTYSVEILQDINSDSSSISITFDIFNCPSEALHTNLVGYMSSSRVKDADLYHFLGDGGYRDYSDFEGNEVYIYNVDTEEATPVGSVTFWMNGQTETNHNLTGGDVWNVDFTGFNTSGTYRLAVEGVGCSENFEIKDDIYQIPYKLGVLGYFYMRIGQDNLDMTPVPRRPLYIQDTDPPTCKIYVTDMHPYHANWSSFAPGDKWDRPQNWIAYKKTGEPTNPNAIGGHSDAFDWDRHLGHVTNIYDMCLAYILSEGALDDDDLRIAESGNGIPDIIDEARNEVDFWLNLRYQGGYSQGLTNPDGTGSMYQSDNTTIAAWANALNSAMLAYSFQIAGMTELRNTYRDSAVIAYNYATNQADQMLENRLESMRGADLKMMAAAWLYNLTGDTEYEDVMNSLCMVNSPNAAVYQNGSYNQLWGAAAYALTNQPVSYSTLQHNIKSSIIAKARSKESDNINSRPSRRGYSSENAWWQTAQDMHRTILAHYLTDNPTDKVEFLDALLMEAGWGLGRNPLNMIQMTTATTELADKRSVENCYTTGTDDGTPGLHPGHTPYFNIEGWGGEMAGSNPKKVLDKFYPHYNEWPHASRYINTRYLWAHSEFTPRQTMRGKLLLYSYLYNLSKSGGSILPVLIADAGSDQRVVDQDENGKESIELDGSGSYSSNSEIISYKWKLEESEIATGKTATIELDTGYYRIILEIEDDNGESATDTVNIEVVAQYSDIEADYDFETDDQLDDWEAINNGEGDLPTASISSEQAHSGSKSVKLAGNYVVNSSMALKKSGSIDAEAEQIIYYVWVPQEMVDASETAAAADSTMGGGIMNYLMFTGWQWRSIWVNLFDMQGDSWNKITYDIPQEAIDGGIIETGLVVATQNAAVGESAIYIDDVTYTAPEPPADYDFEVAAQFDEWYVENFGSNGGTTVANYSQDVSRSGDYSFQISGNFVEGSEHVLRKDGSLADNVNTLAYHVWIPQAIVDSAQTYYDTNGAAAGIIQNYLMHNGWQWISTTFDYHTLKGNDWNRVELPIPAEVVNSTIQSYGVTFKTINMGFGENSVYIDDIYLMKSEEVAIDDENLVQTPTDFELFHNYPNPFNPETKIRYSLPKTTKVKMNIYDIAGHKIETLVNDNKSAGSYEVVFDGSNVASGVYLYSIEADGFTDVKKMVLLK